MKNQKSKFDTKEKIKELQKKIKNITLEEMNLFSKSWISGHIAGLHKYSFLNYCIACFQLEKLGKTLTAIAPFKTWSDKHIRVKTGEKAVHVFAPIIIKETLSEKKALSENEKEKTKLIGYRLVPVFDISQTNGKMENLKIKTGGLQGNWTVGKSIIDYQTLVKLFNIPVKTYKISGIGENGSTDGKTISLLEKSENEMISTYTHELAHLNLHFETNRKELSSELKEVEAESVSFLVCSAIGLTNNKAPLYIKNWGDFSDSIRINKIMSVTEKILATIFDSLKSNTVELTV